MTKTLPRGKALQTLNIRLMYKNQKVYKKFIRFSLDIFGGALYCRIRIREAVI